MNTNDTLFKIKTALNLDNETVIKIYDLIGHKMDPKHLECILKRDSDSGAQGCSYEELGLFLDGLVEFKRAQSQRKGSNNDVIELTNNLILKKLRIALELKEPEIKMIFSLGDAMLSKQQLSSLFRKEDHKNFRVCSDELLVAFLDGLEEFYYEDDSAAKGLS